MYSLAILLVTILAIYAYRLYKDDSNNKNWIIFGITSLASIYVHYYALMAAGIINCALLYYFIKNKKKASIVKIIVSGGIQLVSYIPWVLCFIKQMKGVSKGFWISVEFPKTLFELVGCQFNGNVAESVGFTFSIIIYAYLIYSIIKAKKTGEDYKAGVMALLVYLSVVISAIIICLVLWTIIILHRYLFAITGLYIFGISYFLSKEKNKYIVYGICIITLALGIYSNYKQITMVYDNSNMAQIEYLKDEVQTGDVIVFGEEKFGEGAVVSLYFKDNTQFYYNPTYWGVEEAYKAFGNQLNVYTNTDFLKNCTGRVWIIDSEGANCYNQLFNNENYRKVSEKLIRTKYRDYVYNMILVESVK